MLCAVIDHVQETMPKDSVAMDAFIIYIFFMADHIFIAETVEISLHGLLFLMKFLFKSREGWEIFRF